MATLEEYRAWQAQQNQVPPAFDEEETQRKLEVERKRQEYEIWKKVQAAKQQAAEEQKPRLEAQQKLKDQGVWAGRGDRAGPASYESWGDKDTVKNMAEGVKKAWKGDAEFPDLPAISDTEQWKKGVGAFSKVARAPFSGDEGQANLFLNAKDEEGVSFAAKGYKADKDANGNIMIVDRQGKPVAYANKPGADLEDAVKIGAEIGLMAIPGIGVASKLAKLGTGAKMAAGALAGTEVAADAVAQGLSGEEGYDVARGAFAALGGAASEVIGQVGKVMMDDATRPFLLQKGKDVAQKIGIDNPTDEIAVALGLREEGRLAADIDDKTFRSLNMMDQQGGGKNVLTRGQQMDLAGDPNAQRQLQTEAKYRKRGSNEMERAQFESGQQIEGMAGRQFQGGDVDSRNRIGSMIRTGNKRMDEASAQYKEAIQRLDERDLDITKARRLYESLDQRTDTIVSSFKKSDLLRSAGGSDQLDQFIPTWERYMERQMGKDRSRSLADVFEMSEAINEGYRNSKGAEKAFFGRLRKEFKDWESNELPAVLGRDAQEDLAKFQQARSNYARQINTFNPENKGDRVGQAIKDMREEGIQPKVALRRLFGGDEANIDLTRQELSKLLRAAPVGQRREMANEVKTLLDNRTFGKPVAGKSVAETDTPFQSLSDSMSTMYKGELKDVAERVFTKKELAERADMLRLVNMMAREEKAMGRNVQNFYARLPELGGIRAVLNTNDLMVQLQKPKVKAALKRIYQEQKRTGRWVGPALTGAFLAEESQGE